MKKTILISTLFLICVSLYYSLLYSSHEKIDVAAINLFQQKVADNGCMKISHPALDTISNYDYILFSCNNQVEVELADSLKDRTLKIFPISGRDVALKDENTILLSEKMIKVVTQDRPILFSIESSKKREDHTVEYKLKILKQSYLY